MNKMTRALFTAVVLFFLSCNAATLYASTSFTFTLDQPATTSAGVYSKNGILVRTLWFNVQKEKGANTATWDDLDDEGKPVTPGNYEFRVLVHHMQYQWDGMVGNNSTNQSGTTVHKGMYPLQDIAITGTKAFYTTGYNEAMYDFHRFDTTIPLERLDSWTWVVDTRGRNLGPRKLWDCYGPCWSFVTTDGTNVYFASPEGWTNAEKYELSPGYVIANRVSDDKQSDDVFAHGIELPDLGTPYVFPHGIRVGNKAGISGMSVQKNGNILAVAVLPDNRIYLLDKLSGDVLPTKLDIEKPRRITFDADNLLWVAEGKNVSCYLVTDHMAALATVITGFSNALAVGVSPKEDLVVVADGGASMQLKAFHRDGKPAWVYGQAGGYQKHGPSVTDDKMWFLGSPNAIYSVPDIGSTFLTFAPDGTFWVGDGMNARTLHFEIKGAEPHVIDRISMQPMSYLVAVDQKDPTRVFRNFLEFKVDYSKPLGPDNGSWKLANNWAANVPTFYAASPDGGASGLSNIVTLSNGRTYAQIGRSEKNAAGAVVRSGAEVVELTTDGLRFTGEMNVGGNLMPDDSLFGAAGNGTNGSFETGDTAGWMVWTSGPPKTSSMNCGNTPGIATDGKWYLDIKATGPAAGVGTVASTLGAAVGISSIDRTLRLNFDVRNKKAGFNQLGISLLSVDSLGGVPASAGASPGVTLYADDAWHSYKTTITLPATATDYSVQLRMSFIKEGADPAVTYETYVDNVSITSGPENIPVIDKSNRYWYRKPLTGFDDKGNPHWGPPKIIATLFDPSAGISADSLAGPSAPTDAGVVVYEPSLRNTRHLGGIRQDLSQWAWKAFPSIDTDYNKTRAYPIGYYDLGTNHKVYTGGGIVLAEGRHIIAGYHGEGWGRCQGNQFMHFYDDGLFIGQFGVPGTDASGNKWAPDYSKAGYAGNSYSPALAKVGDELYLYINDEWGTPLQRFHLVGANDIHELSGVGSLGGTIALKVASRAP